MTQIGSVLAGKYRVLAKLGEGGMGSVFRAENLLTGKAVALKCLHPHVMANASSSERLLREARASSSLNHPNIVDVYDVLRDNETMFLVMELLRGRTLRDYLSQSPRPKITEFFSLLLPALSGVGAAHARGIIHRDLKPDNIFLAQVAGSAGIVVKVVDFGIAKLARSDAPTLTQTGVSLGTPFYMSLEQLRGDRDIDQRADVYAFGVMLYEAVTGSLPYEAGSLPELAIKVATSDPPPVKSHGANVPTALARLIDWAVARDRAQRLPDLSTLERELEVFARDRTFRDQMTAPAITLPRVAARPKVVADAASLEAATTALQPQPSAACGPRVSPSAIISAPDTFRVRELVTLAPSKRVGVRRVLVGAVLLGILSAGVWLSTRPAALATNARISRASISVARKAALARSVHAPEPADEPTPRALKIDARTPLTDLPDAKPVAPASAETGAQTVTTAPARRKPSTAQLPRSPRLAKPPADSVPLVSRTEETGRVLTNPAHAPSSSLASPSARPKTLSSLDLVGF